VLSAPLANDKKSLKTHSNLGEPQSIRFCRKPPSTIAKSAKRICKSCRLAYIPCFCMVRRDTPSLRAWKFPEAKSFNTRLFWLRFAPDASASRTSASTHLAVSPGPPCGNGITSVPRSRLPSTPALSPYRSPPPLRSDAVDLQPAQAVTSCLVPCALLVWCLSYPLAHFMPDIRRELKV
jgi:hypothetical protein